MFLCLDSSLFTVGFIAAITCSINTGTGYGGGTAGKLRCVRQDPCREMRKIVSSSFSTQSPVSTMSKPSHGGVYPLSKLRPTAHLYPHKGCLYDGHMAADGDGDDGNTQDS